MSVIIGARTWSSEPQTGRVLPTDSRSKLGDNLTEKFSARNGHDIMQNCQGPKPVVEEPCLRVKCNMEKRGKQTGLYIQNAT